MSPLPDDKPLDIEGLNVPPGPVFEKLGDFKLKDKVGRNTVKIDLTTLKKPLTELLSLYIFKVRGQNNGIRVGLEWKPKLESPKTEEEKHDEIPKP